MHVRLLEQGTPDGFACAAFKQHVAGNTTAARPCCLRMVKMCFHSSGTGRATKDIVRQLHEAQTGVFTQGGGAAGDQQAGAGDILQQATARTFQQFAVVGKDAESLRPLLQAGEQGSQFVQFRF